eukprot:TRINITY_DN3451_c0_g1_i5.p1 TRINITY_DN3451_c0_g1~~TRINITY_DN3451_c0_g1_i5.p1  ORF type:complete len:365 (+),score=47.07 TRINITY_DN3451_c0_g1_i5:76-1170(+)
MYLWLWIIIASIYANSHAADQYSPQTDSFPTIVDTSLLSRDDESFHSCGVLHLNDRYAAEKRFSPRNFDIPQCGVTICDVPQNVLAYRDALFEKKIENVTAISKIISFAKDDGSDPVSSSLDSKIELEKLNNYMRLTGISFRFQDIIINSTFMWYGSVMLGCPAALVANGIREVGCLRRENGYDGGDWLCSEPTNCNPLCTAEKMYTDATLRADCTCVCFPYHECTEGMIGDGICQDKCNVAQRNYDGGDCCIEPSQKKCFDHRRPFPTKSSADFTEVTRSLQTDHRRNLHIFVFNFLERFAGAAWFPWSLSLDYVDYGGLMMQKDYWGDHPYAFRPIIAHEVGHVLGLHHSFHGVTEVSGWNA